MTNRIWQTDGKKDFANAELMARTERTYERTNERLPSYGKTRLVPDAPTSVDREVLCVASGSVVAVEMHRVRRESLCDVCLSADRARWFEAVELERFAHGESRRAFLAKVKREGARLRAEKRAAS